jgi:hypothetical protein
MRAQRAKVLLCASVVMLLARRYDCFGDRTMVLIGPRGVPDFSAMSRSCASM